MSTVPNPARERAYPMPAPADDHRFTLGLVFAVIQVLTDAGYPPITAGGDLVALQQALYGFLYRPASHTADQVREVIDGLGPLPAGVDPETVTAVRRIAQHFREHGCLTWTAAEDGTR